ncbi:unnamed protein product [Absidia cylindrospora]
MKLILFLLIAATLASARPTRLSGNTRFNVRQLPPSDMSSAPINVDETLYYRNQGPPDRLQFGKCIPLEKNGDPVKFAKFAQPASCYGYKDNLCTELALPVPFLLPANVPLDNPLNLGSVVVGSYLCRSLKNEPLLKPIHPLLKPALDVLQPQKQQPQAIGQSSSAAANGGGSVAPSSSLPSLDPATIARYNEIAAALQAEQAGMYPGDDAEVWPSTN